MIDILEIKDVSIALHLGQVIVYVYVCILIPCLCTFISCMVASIYEIKKVKF